MWGWTKLYLDWRRRRKKLKLVVLTVHERHHRREKRVLSLFGANSALFSMLENVKDLEIVRSRTERKENMGSS